MEDGFAMLKRTLLVPELDDNVSRFKTLFHADVNSDAQFRFIECAGTRLCVLYIEGMADDRKISDFILRACVEHAIDQPRTIDAAYLMEKVVEIAQCEAEQRVSDILDGVVTGMTAVLIDGCEEAVMLETRGYPARQVNRTTNESVVIGAQEGFVESLRTNMTLMRRYVPSAGLITECIAVGSLVPTQIVLVYLRGVADEIVVDAVRSRLKAIDARTVQGLVNCTVADLDCDTCPYDRGVSVECLNELRADAIAVIEEQVRIMEMMTEAG